MWALALLLLTSLTWAAETSLSFSVKANDGEDLKVRAFYYLNEFGGHEVRLESASLPRINKRINSIYGYGRDLDDDGLIDTWFVIDPFYGLEVMSAPCGDRTCGDPIRRRIFNNFNKSRKALFYSAYASLVGYLFMSLDNRYSKEIDFYKEMVDLEEFRIRLERETHSKTPTLNKAQMKGAYQALIYGYQENLNMLQKARGRDAWLLLGADVAMWVSGTVVFKALGVAAKKLIGDAVFKNFQLYLDRFIEAQSGNVTKLLERIKSSGKADMAATIAAGRMSRDMFQKIFFGGMSALKARSQLIHSLLPMKEKMLVPIKAGLSQWKYIALNGGIQVTSEAFANFDDVKDDDPAVMAQNVLSNRNIQQNVTYMATETVFMSAAVASLKTVKARFAVCGMIALTNSAVTNFFMKEDVNPERVALDTGWEMAIGSAQVQLDIAALAYFEKLSEKKRNPKLKLLGYAVVLVDQGIGYFAYAKTTNYVEKREQDKLREKDEINLVPIFVEGA